MGCRFTIELDLVVRPYRRDRPAVTGGRLDGRVKVHAKCAKGERTELYDDEPTSPDFLILELFGAATHRPSRRPPICNAGGQQVGEVIILDTYPIDRDSLCYEVTGSCSADGEVTFDLLVACGCSAGRDENGVASAVVLDRHAVKVKLRI